MDRVKAVTKANKTEMRQMGTRLASLAEDRAWCDDCCERVGSSREGRPDDQADH